MNEYYLDNFGRADEHGQVSFTVDELCKLMLNNISVDTLIVERHSEVEYVNNWLLGDNQHQQFTIYEPITEDPLEYHQKKQQTWLTPQPWASMDIKEWVLEQCDTEEQIIRVLDEMELFEKHNMLPLLRHLKYLVDHFRENKILWGIGRGSSCSSYCLFLMGVHRVDSLKYNLNYCEFFGE